MLKRRNAEHRRLGWRGAACPKGATSAGRARGNTGAKERHGTACNPQPAACSQQFTDLQRLPSPCAACASLQQPPMGNSTSCLMPSASLRLPRVPQSGTATGRSPGALDPRPSTLDPRPSTLLRLFAATRNSQRDRRASARSLALPAPRRSSRGLRTERIEAEFPGCFPGGTSGHR